MIVWHTVDTRPKSRRGSGAIPLRSRVGLVFRAALGN